MADLNSDALPDLTLTKVWGQDSAATGGMQDLGGLRFAAGGYNIVSGSDRLFARGALNLANGISFRAKDSTDTDSKGLELLGSIIRLSPTEAVQIYPTPNSFAQAIRTVQSGPASGSDAGPIYFNQISGTYTSTITGDGPDGEDPASINLIHFSMGVGGPDFAAESAAALGFGLVVSADDPLSGDRLGFNGGVYTEYTSAARLYGGSTGATIAGTGSAAQLIGFETDVFLLDTGTTPIRIGFHSWSGGTGQATDVDAAYGIGIHGGAGRAPWMSGIVLFTGDGGGGQPIDTTGNFLYADHAMTLADFLDLTNVTVTGDILKHTNLNITGGGNIHFGGKLSSKSMISASGTSVAIRLGDDSGAASLSALNVLSNGGRFGFVSSSAIAAPANGSIFLSNSDQTGFTSLWLGPYGTTYNMIKHGGAGLLDVRLTDDSNYGTIRGKLRTHANAVSETPSATHTMVIYDAAGTAYRVLCVV